MSRRAGMLDGDMVCLCVKEGGGRGDAGCRPSLEKDRFGNQKLLIAV